MKQAPSRAKEQHNSMLLLWGSLLVLMGLATSLGAYYAYSMMLRYGAFYLLLLGLLSLFLSMKQSIEMEVKTPYIPLILTILMGVLYVALRTQLHRFDFGVGDAADYYIAGVCSVTYGQDIGFFLPLTASISALGYSMFGVEYAPAINVMLYMITVPISYHLLRRLELDVWVSILMTFFIIINPLSIWFSKTSFSEPLWQLLLLVFAIIFYRISNKERVVFSEIGSYFLLLSLVPFLRGEGVLYYGLVLLLALYHFWKYGNLKSALILIYGLFVIAGSIHFTLGIRAHYLLEWQFSRILPDITAIQLMSILYSIAGVMMGGMVLINFIKKSFSRIPLPLVITFLAIVFKVAIAYIYAQKKSVPFMELLVFREYGLALGNFGLPLTVLIGIGLLIVHYKAILGERLALLLVVMYAIFYFPFVMQGVTFQDPHEVFLYWNRYYFSIFMMIHLFSLALVVQYMHEKSVKFIESSNYRALAIAIFMITVSLSSLNLKVANITISESYLENSHKVFSWLKQRVGRQSISILYDDAIRYERHNGLYDAKVFTSRMFTVMKINAKGWQKVDVKQLESNIKLNKDMYKGKYLVCISSKKPKLKNKALTLVDQTMFPISWREHYRAQPRSKDEVLGDVGNSYKNELKLYITLYKTPIRVKR